ncbi:MAG TPA: hypothetical protein GXX29_06255 [Firmicutes bacterium]|nr:hypothetical protein [Bacillota bacterium]
MAENKVGQNTPGRQWLDPAAVAVPARTEMTETVKLEARQARSQTCHGARLASARHLSAKRRFASNSLSGDKSIKVITTHRYNQNASSSGQKRTAGEHGEDKVQKTAFYPYFSLLEALV